MTSRLMFVCGILILNFLVSVGCLVWNVFYRKNKNYITHFIVMLLCPLVGPGFYVMAYLFFKFFFSDPVDLADVIFSKEKVKSNVRAEEERESNLVSLEEAIEITNEAELRKLMMNVVRGDIQKFLSSISLALNSEDTETAHYAASVLQDALNEFRISVERYRKQITDICEGRVDEEQEGELGPKKKVDCIGNEEDEETEGQAEIMGQDAPAKGAQTVSGNQQGAGKPSRGKKQNQAGDVENERRVDISKELPIYAQAALEYMDQVLQQKVFTDMEQISYVHVMDELAERFYEHAREQMTSENYEAVSMRLLEIGDYEMCQKWCGRAREQFPDSLATYTCQLKLYFSSGQRAHFFEVIEDLKQSSVVVDKETLELLRVFR